MKLHELFEPKLLLEDTVTLEEVRSSSDLIDPKTGEYYTGVVNVAGNVNLRNNKKLTKLPVKFGTVGGYFYCHDNAVSSLKGAPSSVGGSVDFWHNQLNSLKGAPSSIGGDLDFHENPLTSLEGVHKIIKRINGVLYLTGNHLIKSGGIGLLLIEGLKDIDADQPAFKIINKYLGQGKKGLLYCQDELIDAGYEEFAKL
jgi:hypothetical protein